MHVFFRKITAAIALITPLLLTSYTFSYADPNDPPRHSNPAARHDPSDQSPPAHQQHHDSIEGLPGIDQTQFDAGLSVINNPAFQNIIQLMPALLASMSDRGDGSADPELIEQARNDVNHSSLPQGMRNILNNVLNFFYKYDPQAGPMARPNSQKLQNFLFPAVGRGCLNGGNAVGMALAAAGPQRAPAPGPREGETAYVFTALSTGPAVFDTAHPLSVRWSNLDTHKSGLVPLRPNRLINPHGPATYTAIVPTGHGRVLSWVTGTVTAKLTPSNQNTFSCKISPAVGLIRN